MNQINYAYKCRKINNHQSNNRAEPNDIGYNILLLLVCEFTFTRVVFAIQIDFVVT